MLAEEFVVKELQKVREELEHIKKEYAQYKDSTECIIAFKTDEIKMTKEDIKFMADMFVQKTSTSIKTEYFATEYVFEDTEKSTFDRIKGIKESLNEGNDGRFRF